METITILPSSPESVIASDLIRQLDADLSDRYPGEPIHGIDPAGFEASGGFFLLAWCGVTPVGCGAFRPVDEHTVEIKRMFVGRNYRGRGIARAILAALESEAAQRGFSKSILETAANQPEAIALYRACYYREIHAFGPSERSLCFGKTLKKGSPKTTRFSWQSDYDQGPSEYLQQR